MNEEMHEFALSFTIEEIYAMDAAEESYYDYDEAGGQVVAVAAGGDDTIPF